jgi:raffinose/stachyose/melibiose transport system permease protein
VTRPQAVSTFQTGSDRSGRLAGSRLGTTLFLAAYAIIAVGPLLLVLNNSFRTTRDIYASPLGLPTIDGMANFATAWTRASFSTFFFNSVLVTVGALVVGVGSATLAGYALGRFKFPGRQVLSGLFLAGMLLPIQLGVVPIFYLLQSMKLVDTHLGLILVYAAHTLPVSILLLSVFFRQLPDELEEAARLDGAGRFQIFFFIMLPLVRPALATVIVVQCAPIWNDFFYPLVLLRSSENYTLPVGLTAFMGQYQSDYGALFAALVIVSAPIITLFVLATRHVVAGLTAGVGK